MFVLIIAIVKFFAILNEMEKMLNANDLSIFFTNFQFQRQIKWHLRVVEIILMKYRQFRILIYL